MTDKDQPAEQPAEPLPATTTTPAGEAGERPSTPPGVNIQDIKDSNLTVTGDIVGGDKTTVEEHIYGDKIVQNITQIIRNPALWQDTAWRFVSQHRLFFPLALLLLAGLVALYWPVKDLYLISWFYLAVTAVCLLIAAWGGYTLYRFRPATYPRARLAVTVAASLAVAGLIGSQAWRIANPPTFTPRLFGIALAELGEGADLRRSAAASEITDEVYKQLCEAVRRAFPDSADPCAPAAAGADERPIAISRIGIIPDTPTAQQMGHRIGADIVIWGRVRSTLDGVSISYTVLESLDQAVNPEYPIVLPVVVKSIEFSSGTIGREVVEETVTELATVMSRFTLGLKAYLDLDFTAAARHFQQAVDSLPPQTTESVARERPFDLTTEGRSLLYFYLGRSYLWLNRHDEAERWLELAEAANPIEPAYTHSLAQLYDRLEQPDQREALLRQSLDLLDDWLQLNPQDPTAYYDRAEVYRILDKPRFWEFAEADYRQTLALRPDFIAASINLAWLYHDQGRFDDAILLLEESIAQTELSGANPAFANLTLAIMRWRAGRPDLADAAFRKAIEGRPDLAGFHYEYARFLEDQGEIDAAAARYEQLPALTDNRAWAYQQQAQFWERRGLYEKAAASYQEAIRANRNDMLLRYYLARLYYEQLNQPEKAFDVYEAAVAENPGPNSIGADLLFLGYAYHLSVAEPPDLPLAATMYERALALRPFNWFGINQLANIYLQLGRSADAVALYQRVVDNPDQFDDDQLETARDMLSRLTATP